MPLNKVLSQDLPGSADNKQDTSPTMLGTQDRPQRAYPVEEDDGQDAEHSPLLRMPDQASEEESSPSAYHRPGASPTVFTVTLAASIIILVLDVVASVPMTPRLVMFEDIICRNYYDAWGGRDGRGDCKVEPVQAELAVVNGWKEMFDTIPGSPFASQPRKIALTPAY